MTYLKALLSRCLAISATRQPVRWLDTASSIVRMGYITALSIFALLAPTYLAAQCNLSLNAGPDIRTCTNNDAQLSANTEGVILHSLWSPSTGLNNPFSLHPVARIDSQMTYRIVADVYDESANLIQNFDFSAGDTGFSSLYESGETAPGGYIIDTIGTALFQDAKPCEDPSNGGGNMMLIRVSDAANVNIWCQEVTVSRNKDYHFFAFATGLRTNDPPVIQLSINDELLSSGTIGSFACSWQKVKGDWNARNETTANICLRVSDEDIGAGTDFALDDLHFFEVCHLEDEVQVEIVPFEVITADTIVEIACEEELVLSPTIQASGYPFQTHWTTDNGSIISDSVNTQVTVNAPGTYHLQVNLTDANLQCHQEAIVAVEEVSSLALQVAGPREIHCQQPALALVAEHPGDPAAFSYEWLHPNGDRIGDDQTTSIDVSTPGEYQLLVTERTTGCTSIEYLLITESRLDSIQFQVSQPDCQRTFGEISVQAVYGGTPPYRYGLAGDANFQDSPDFQGLEQGNHLLLVQDSNQCEIGQSVTISSIQPLVITAPSLLEIEQGVTGSLPITVNLPDSDLQIIQWSPPNGLSCTDCLEPDFTPARSTLYTLEITAESGCSSTANIQVNVKIPSDYFLPNAFSPNDDGQNDYFFPLVDVDKIESIKRMSIFDRFGGLLFDAKNFPPNSPNFGWSGQVGGQAMPTGVYTYLIELETKSGEIQRQAGQVLLLR